jgi:hypothetical protein
MYSKLAIAPLVEIRPVITKRVTVGNRFPVIRPTFPADIITGNPFGVISGLFLFSKLGGATFRATTPPTPAQIPGIGVVFFAAIIAYPFYYPHINPL